MPLFDACHGAKTCAENRHREEKENCANRGSSGNSRVDRLWSLTHYKYRLFGRYRHDNQRQRGTTLHSGTKVNPNGQQTTWKAQAMGRRDRVVQQDHSLRGLQDSGEGRGAPSRGVRGSSLDHSLTDLADWYTYAASSYHSVERSV